MCLKKHKSGRNKIYETNKIFTLTKHASTKRSQKNFMRMEEKNISFCKITKMTGILFFVCIDKIIEINCILKCSSV